MIRAVLALPLLIAQLLFAVVAQLLSVTGRAMLHAGVATTRHGYVPVMRLRRRVRGEPLWKPADLSIGVGPSGQREQEDLIAWAAANGKVVLWPCDEHGVEDRSITPIVFDGPVTRTVLPLKPPPREASGEINIGPRGGGDPPAAA